MREYSEVPDKAESKLHFEDARGRIKYVRGLIQRTANDVAILERLAAHCCEGESERMVLANVANRAVYMTGNALRGAI